MKKVLLILLLGLIGPVAAYTINPSREYINTPDSLGLEYQALDIRTDDGYTLNAWIYAPNPEKDNDAASQLKAPLLVFAATKDEATTLADAKRLAAGKSSPCKVIPYEGGHLSGFQALSTGSFGDGYVEKVIRFLAENED